MEAHFTLFPPKLHIMHGNVSPADKKQLKTRLSWFVILSWSPSLTSASETSKNRPSKPGWETSCNQKTSLGWFKSKKACLQLISHRNSIHEMYSKQIFAACNSKTSADFYAQCPLNTVVLWLSCCF